MNFEQQEQAAKEEATRLLGLLLKKPWTNKDQNGLLVEEILSLFQTFPRLANEGYVLQYEYYTPLHIFAVSGVHLTGVRL